jgi:hypothetical protein
MASLEELRHAVFPTALDLAARSAPRGGARDAGPDRSVGWVRVLKSRVPAFEALERTDLAILPDAALESLSAAGVEPASIADALERGGAAAALFVGDAQPNEPATVAAERLLALGVPAWRLVDADPAVVERSVIGFLVNERAELERQAGRLERRLAALALRGADLAEHAAAIAGFFGRAVAIEGPRGEALAIHAPEGRHAAAAAAAGYLRRPRRAALRTPLPPVGDASGSRPSGAIALLGDEPATELERLASAAVASLLALELGRAEAGDRRGRPGSLPAEGPPWVVLVARQGSVGPDDTVEGRARLRDRLRRLAPARRMALRGDPTSLEIRIVASVQPPDHGGAIIAGRISQLLERTVAVSKHFGSEEERPVAEADARATLEAVEALSHSRPKEARVVMADRLPAYRLLGSLHNLPDGRRQAELLLEPLLAGRARGRDDRLRTLGAVLEGPGLIEAAQRLRIHRNTLGYRLGRIEDETGWRLDDPDLRLALALAVRLVQNDQIERSPADRTRSRQRRSTG